MIKSRKDLKEYLRADKEALGIKYRRPRFMTDFEWRYEITLRKAEYYNNFRLNLLRYYYLFKLRRLQLKYQTFIPMYTCGKGLSIAHIGGIRVNGNARLGEYCRIQEGVTIGDNVLIAPNAYVNFDVPSNSIVIGNPGKIIPNRPDATEGYCHNLV